MKKEFLREPNTECVFCSHTQKSCRALNRLYCAEELRPCAFFKSADDHDEYGRPLKKGGNK